MKIWWRTLLAYVAHVTVGLNGTIVYPVIIHERSEGGTKAKLAITPTHSLEMNQVSIFGDTYITQMEINGTAVDLLLDSAVLQRNMYECSQNMATYTVHFLAGKIHVEGVVNTTHAIRPITHTRKWMIRVPHKVFKIADGFSDHIGNAIDGNDKQDFLESSAQHLQNATMSSRENFVTERDLLSGVGAKHKLPRDMKFEIEVHIVLDAAMGEIYNFARSIARYTATLMNIVKLKIQTLKKHKMSVRVVGIRQLHKQHESDALVLNGDYLDIHASLGKFGEYTLKNPLLNNADVVILLTGREAAGFKHGMISKEYTGK
ncbi:uncharacterized protein LOC144159993 [Haemaphysalis longicornis]